MVDFNELVNKNKKQLENKRLWRKEAYVQLGVMARHVDPKEVVKSCVSCLHWDTDKEFCTMYNSRPPAIVIAFGCKSYDDIDNVPF